MDEKLKAEEAPLELADGEVLEESTLAELSDGLEPGEDTEDHE